MADDHQRAEWIREAVSRWEAPLVRYASGRLRDLERARDVVQEAFLRLCRQKRSAVEPHLAEWLFTVCRNLTVDERRKETRMQPLSPETAERAAPATQAPDAAAARRETRSEMSRALDALPERQRELVRLKFQEGLSYRQMSRVTSLSVSNVGYLLHTAIATLRTRLKADSVVAGRRER